MYSKIAVIILVVVVVFAGYLFFKDNFKADSQINGFQVALKTASFLDKNLEPDGSFLYGFFCDQSASAKCRPVFLREEHFPHVDQIIYTYLILAEESGDKSYREKADKAVSYLSNRCNTDIKFCDRNLFILYQYYKETNKEAPYLSYILRPAESFITMNIQDTVNNDVGYKLAWLYEITGDTKYKNRLIEVAETELKTPLGNDRLGYSTQVAWSIYLPAYRITGDSKYLTAIEVFFDNFKISENLNNYRDPNNIAKAVETLINLADLSVKKDQYKIMAHDILQTIIYESWDTPENQKFNGDYGFVTNREEFSTNKLVFFNGWITKLFILMKNENFILPKT